MEYEKFLKAIYKESGRPDIYQIEVVHKDGCSCCHPAVKSEHTKKFSFKQKWKSRRNSVAKEVRQK